MSIFHFYSISNRLFLLGNSEDMPPKWDARLIWVKTFYCAKLQTLNYDCVLYRHEIVRVAVRFPNSTKYKLKHCDEIMMRGRGN